VRKVLTAAAMTYVAGALAALSQLIYFFLLTRRD
jgi:Zn-dependent membrane protease YugP